MECALIHYVEVAVKPKSQNPGKFQLPDQHLILRRLMWPLTATFVLLTLLVTLLMWWQHNQYQQATLTHNITDIASQYQDLLEEQIELLGSLLDLITADNKLQAALQAGDRNQLLKLSRSTFESMQKNGATHFYFHAKNRKNILQIPQPEINNDHSERFTLREAERTGIAFGGIELDRSGLLTLNVVHPVFANGTLLGYVELGREMNGLLGTLHRDSDFEIALSLHKRHLQRKAWESHLAAVGKQADWDSFPQDVIIFSSLDPLPDELMQGHLQNYNMSDHGRSDMPAMHVNHGIWRVGFLPIINAAGLDIGDLAIMIDLSSQNKQFQHTIAMTGAGVAVVLTALMAFLYALLRKTDDHLVRQQQKIHHAEIQRQAIFDVVIDGLILINDQGLIEMCNPATETIFGYLPGELQGKNINILMPEPYHSEHDGSLHAYTHGGKARIIGIGREVQGKRKNGSIFPIELAVAEAYIDQRQQFVGVIRDITQRKLTETALIEARDAAEQASRAKSAFLSSMSHELRTPLNAVLGFGQILQLNTSLDASGKDSLDEIMKGGQHLLTLVNDVLDLAKIESEQLSISLHTVKLDDLVTDCFAMVEPLALARNIQLSHTSLTGFAVRADAARLKQVLLNLLGNAIKYNREAGKVQVEVAPVASHYLRISIIDTGRGIPADKFDALFEPFNRLGAENDAIEGTGIGLAIALRITELMGGILGVESEVGVGSRFWIELPGSAGS